MNGIPNRLGLIVSWNAKTGPESYNEAPGTYLPIGHIAEGGLSIDNQTDVVEFKGPESGGALERRLWVEPKGSTPIYTVRIGAMTSFEWSLVFGADKVGYTGTHIIVPGSSPCLWGRLKIAGYDYRKSQKLSVDVFAMAKADPFEIVHTQNSVFTMQVMEIASTYNTGTLYGLTVWE